MQYSLTVLLVVLSSLSWAQTDGRSISWNPPTDGNTLVVAEEGDVTIHTPAKIEALLRDHAERKNPQQGYRVQIFLGDRTTAENTKRAFLLKNPDTPAYLSWLAPNFRLRVGDLRTRLEAEHLLHELKVTYPGSYIVPDRIEMPRVE